MYAYTVETLDRLLEEFHVSRSALRYLILYWKTRAKIEEDGMYLIRFSDRHAAKDLGVSVQMVSKIKKELVEKGVLVRDGGLVFNPELLAARIYLPRQIDSVEE